MIPFYPLCWRYIDFFLLSPLFVLLISVLFLTLPLLVLLL